MTNERKTETLTREEIVAAIRRATRTGESVDLNRLHDRLCRVDAVGRISRRDSEYFDAVLAEMVRSGEVRKTGPFLSSVEHRLEVAL